MQPTARVERGAPRLMPDVIRTRKSRCQVSEAYRSFGVKLRRPGHVCDASELSRFLRGAGVVSSGSASSSWGLALSTARRVRGSSVARVQSVTGHRASAGVIAVVATLARAPLSGVSVSCGSRGRLEVEVGTFAGPYNTRLHPTAPRACRGKATARGQPLRATPRPGLFRHRG
jgi:hypothetical protein